MKRIAGQLGLFDGAAAAATRTVRLAATDLSNHLACRHLTTLDLQVARGERPAPQWADPHTAVLRELGARHEAAYLEYLANEKKLEVVNLGDLRDASLAIAKTLELMGRGVDAIAQGALGDGNWFGRPDVLLRVDTLRENARSENGRGENGRRGKWDWSYEVVDTKLARDTKAATILQISLYSELLEKAQGCPTEWMWVIPPGAGIAGVRFSGERYRVGEYAAYFRYVKDRLERAANANAAAGGNRATRGNGAAQENEAAKTYPELVQHCDVCRWFRECDTQRRADDHLSLVAGIRRQQRVQLEEWGVATVAKLAAMPIPVRERPERGSREALEKAREQARVQVQGREEKRLVHEAILPVAEGMGFCRLPEPSGDDVFVDLEGDPFVGEAGLQYLFGFAWRDSNGEMKYEKRWALNREEEKRWFEWLVDEVMRRREANARMHVYHFGAYEPAALKRLMGMYATREDEIDRLLRAGALVDLHQAFKQGLRASVEEYSLKKLEAFCGFARAVPLEESRTAMRYVEHRLELGVIGGGNDFPEQVRATMEGYNRDDCFATAALRDWLEGERAKLVAGGVAIPRPPDKIGDASEKLQEKLDRAAALTDQLCTGIPADPTQRSNEQQAQWLLAQLLSWHRREDKCAWQEGYRLAEMTDEDLVDERVGLTRMRLEKRVDAGQQVPTDRYLFEPHRTNVRAGKDVYFGDERFGQVTFINAVKGVVEIKKTRKTSEVHPSTVYMWDAPLNTDSQASSLYRIGEWVKQNGVDSAGQYRAGRDLLLRRAPRLRDGEKLKVLASEKPENAASRVALALDDSVFAIQGPPGSGKTFTGARMICELVREGRKVGATALSHKVIRNLLNAVVDAAIERDIPGVRCLHRENDGQESESVAVAKRNNEEALEALQCGSCNVVGGTSWLWTAESAADAVDVLFIDEAGQMSLADVLAVSQAAKSLVLLGDPQQLERPLKGSHPDGAEKSALEHLIGAHKTIPSDLGMLLPESWRLHPNICAYTSATYYENKLSAHATATSRVIQGHEWLEGAGLWLVPIKHEGNRNSCAEEVEAVAEIVEGLLRPEVRWYRSAGNPRALTQEDILIVAPYNAQVADLCARLPGLRIGTVDKFQGQEAPVVIYSLTTSSPEDAPRGMEFLYSLNRLNVATSRAMTAVIVVGSPRLFEPDCRTPRQMQLANALCHFREKATPMPSKQAAD